jgi:type I restriction enzyme S subunit
LSHPIFNKFIFNHVDSETAQPNISATTIGKYEFMCPELKIQQKIAAVLSALDSKIELNTKINNNLEQQFNELYKQYFSSEQSERWDSVPLSEMIFFQEGPGIRNWQYVAENGTRFINIRCINDGDINTATANMISNEEATGKYKHFMLEENDIVMSCSGTLGRYAIVRKEHLPLCLNTSVIRFRSIEQAEDFTYIYGYLTSPEFLNKQAEMACGSVQSNFGPTHLKKITMKKPPKELRLAFHERARPLLNAIIHNRRESAHLAIVRDALLPKLMSGEIDVSKVDISDPSYLDKLLFSEEMIKRCILAPFYVCLYDPVRSNPDLKTLRQKCLGLKKLGISCNLIRWPGPTFSFCSSITAL